MSKTFDGMSDIGRGVKSTSSLIGAVWGVFWRTLRHLIEASGALVDGADHLVASDAIHPAAHAAAVAVDSAFSTALRNKAHGHLLERVRLQRTHARKREEWK